MSHTIDGYVTIAQLAKRVGTHKAHVYRAIQRGTLPEPERHPDTGWRVYDEPTADRIAIWWLQKLARGWTRGPGSLERMQAARERLREAQEEAATYAG